MRVMDLTPELFEKTEFTERRRGYDIDQVETFLEEAGTALAQLLAKVRHIEERAAQAEARLAESDQRIADADERAVAAGREVAEAEARAQHAERAAQEAVAGAAAAGRAGEQAEVEQAAKTLLMAKRTAEATINEARGQAQALLEDSQGRAQRQLNEANAEAAELVTAAQAQAEAEYSDRRASIGAEVEVLEARRSQLGDVITQLEARLAAYREDLNRTAQELVDLADDPSRLGGRPTMSLHPDEVLVSSDFSKDPGEPSGGDGGGAHFEEPAVEPVIEEPAPRVTDTASEGGAQASAGGGEPIASATTLTVEAQDDTYVDLTASGATTTTGETDAASSDERWAPGSWSEVEAQLTTEPEPRPVDDRPTEAVSQATDGDGAQRDRFMEELDSAVNEAVPVEGDAMTAFFEGSNGSRNRRFGWRR